MREIRQLISRVRTCDIPGFSTQAELAEMELEAIESTFKDIGNLQKKLFGESKIGGTAHNNERKEISALIAEIYSVAPSTREYSREEVITFLQRAKTSSIS